MKNGRSIIELAGVLVCVGLLCWQQVTIVRLRREGAEVSSAERSVVRLLADSEPEGERTHPTSSRSDRPSKPAKAKADVAALQAENRALREQNEALTAASQRANYTAEVATAERALADIFVATGGLADASTLPPDTTGLLPSGEPASWSARQATGAPDTPQAGDFVTAWASSTPDGGEEWLQLSFDKATDIAQINVHESYNPGAVSRITAMMPDGSEKTLWEGIEPPGEAPVEVGFPVPPGVRGDQIKVYMDTARVPGWNEVDAVELVGTDGSRQWATSSTASSYYGDRRHPSPR